MKKKMVKEKITILILILIIVLSIATIFIALNSKDKSLNNNSVKNIEPSSGSGQIKLFVEGEQNKNGNS